MSDILILDLTPGFNRLGKSSCKTERETFNFYASAFRRRRHYVFGLSVRPSVCPSVRPSVRSLKYPLLTCTWVRWSTRPTVTVLRHVRPSVRLSVCPSVRPSGEVSGHLPENAWRDWPEILYADVSWPSSELISLWLWSVDFSEIRRGNLVSEGSVDYRQTSNITRNLVGNKIIDHLDVVGACPTFSFST